MKRTPLPRAAQLRSRKPLQRTQAVAANRHDGRHRSPARRRRRASLHRMRLTAPDRPGARDSTLARRLRRPAMRRPTLQDLPPRLRRRPPRPPPPPRARRAPAARPRRRSRRADRSAAADQRNDPIADDSLTDRLRRDQQHTPEGQGRGRGPTRQRDYVARDSPDRSRTEPGPYARAASALPDDVLPTTSKADADRPRPSHSAL